MTGGKLLFKEKPKFLIEHEVMPFDTWTSPMYEKHAEKMTSGIMKMDEFELGRFARDNPVLKPLGSPFAYLKLEIPKTPPICDLTKFTIKPEIPSPMQIKRNFMILDKFPNTVIEIMTKVPMPPTIVTKDAPGYEPLCKKLGFNPYSGEPIKIYEQDSSPSNMEINMQYKPYIGGARRLLKDEIEQAIQGTRMLKDTDPIDEVHNIGGEIVRVKEVCNNNLYERTTIAARIETSNFSNFLNNMPKYEPNLGVSESHFGIFNENKSIDNVINEMKESRKLENSFIEDIMKRNVDYAMGIGNSFNEKPSNNLISKTIDLSKEFNSSFKLKNEPLYKPIKLEPKPVKYEPPPVIKFEPEPIHDHVNLMKEIQDSLNSKSNDLVGGFNEPLKLLNEEKSESSLVKDLCKPIIDCNEITNSVLEKKKKLFGL